MPSTIKSSTGCAAKLMVTGSLKALFDGGKIEVCTGAAPATADAARTGDVIWTIQKDDGEGGVEGLVFDAAASGRSAVKPSDDTWGGPTVAGVAGYGRLVAAADDGTESTTQARIQFLVRSTGGLGLYLSNTTLTTDADVLAKTLAAFSVTLPTY